MLTDDLVRINAGTFGVELRNLEVSRELSRETIAYSAVVHVNGVAAFHARNNGRGGADVYTPIPPRGADMLRHLEDWARSQPPLRMEGMTLPMNLELWMSCVLDRLEH